MPSYGADKSLSDLYIFYNNLSEYDPSTYDRITGSLWRPTIYDSQLREYSEILRSAAQQELAKEKSILRNIFGVELPFDITDKGAIRTVTKTVDRYLRLKKAYEAIDFKKKTLTKSFKKSLKGFSSTFRSLLNDREGEIKNRITSSIKEDTPIAEAIDTVLRQELESLAKQAFNSVFQNSSDDIDYSTYTNLLNAIEDVNTGDVLSNLLYNAYGLDSIHDTIMEQVERARRQKKSMKKVYSSMDLNSVMSEKVVSSGRTIRKIENSIAASLIQALSTNGEFTVSGDTGGVIDLGSSEDTVEFNLDFSQWEDSFDYGEALSYELIDQQLKRLGDKILKIQDSFSVYHASIDSILPNLNTDNISTPAVNLNSYVDGLDSDAIGSILNTASGAIASGFTSEYEEALAGLFLERAFRGANFDIASDSNSLTVFDFNGGSATLSGVLLALADAIDMISYAPRDYVNVEISDTSILYPAAPKDYPSSASRAWGSQKGSARVTKKVSVNFFLNLAQLINI